ncbi:MAG: hypothetical protein O7F75_03870 [Alphaproteobacteria bacterium]|nr:hypothetical protein [Alphaproteobacteria bacterium]MCZ6847967.1 hypothetical protein [Alphaproteobacteria bacterium]
MAVCNTGSRFAPAAQPMALLSPIEKEPMPKHPFRTRIAHAGLDSLMTDPRYFDANQPEHGAMLDMVQRGFQLLLDGPKDRARHNPALTGLTHPRYRAR